MSEDPVKYEVPGTKVPHLEVVVDYLRGLPYKEILLKYNITCGGLQYSLEKIGVKPNRIKSAARLPKIKTERIKSYDHND